jgi:tetratricopeptide (TPR) repeat protein
MRDNNMLSLIPHLYAVAKKAVWIHDDQICDSLVDTACQIAYLFRHIDTSVYLCHERLKGVSINNFQRVQAHFEMGRSYELMANLPLAQTHFTEALQFIESSSDYDKARMEFYYLRVLGKLGICYQKQQMYAEAQHMYQTLLSLWRDRPGDNRRDIAFVSNNLALIYQNSGQIQKAMKTYKEVLEVMRGDSEVPAISLATGMCKDDIVLSTSYSLVPTITTWKSQP